MQVTQQVYVAEEWVRNARDKVKAKAHSHFEVEKALRALKEKHKKLGKKLTIAEREHSSALADLKNLRPKLRISVSCFTQRKLSLPPRNN